MDEHFQPESSVRANIEENFVKNIPLTRLIHVDSLRQRIIIPLQWEDLKASPESKFRANFVAMSETGFMHLLLEGDIIGNHWDGYLKCVVTKFSYPRAGADAWSSKIPEVLDPSNLDNIVVYMEKYIKNLYPDTYGKNSTEPE